MDIKQNFSEAFGNFKHKASDKIDELETKAGIKPGTVGTKAKEVGAKALDELSELTARGASKLSGK